MTDYRREDGAWNIDPEQLQAQLVSWRGCLQRQKAMALTMAGEARENWGKALPLLEQMTAALEGSLSQAGAEVPKEGGASVAVDPGHIGMVWNDQIRAMKTMSWTMSNENQVRFAVALPLLEAIAEGMENRSAPDPAARKAALLRWESDRRARQTPDQVLIDNLLDLESALQALSALHEAADREPIEEMLTILRKHYRQMRAKYGTARSPKALFETPYTNPPETP